MTDAGRNHGFEAKVVWQFLAISPLPMWCYMVSGGFKVLGGKVFATPTSGTSFT